MSMKMKTSSGAVDVVAPVNGAYAPIDAVRDLIVLPLLTPHSATASIGFGLGVTSGRNYAFNGGGAPGDYIEWDAYLSAGTWAIYLTTLQQNNGGQGQMSIDGTNVGSLIEFYAASTTVDVLVSITGITVATSGVYPVRLTVPSKDASSSLYRALVQTIVLRRTASGLTPPGPSTPDS